MNICKDLIRHGLEFARAIDRHQYEVTPSGIRFPKQRAIIAGAFTTWINGADMQVDPNVVPLQALNYLLKAGIKASGGLATWYIAPFVGNVTPDENLTALNFDSVLTEFTDYDETTRQAWTVPTDPTAGAYSNSAAPAVFTAASAVGTSPGVDIYGAVIISASAKSATTGKTLCGSLFDAPRNVKSGVVKDKLTVQYDVAAASA
jgi:hypothetical protein